MVIKSKHADFAEQVGVKLGVLFSKIPLTPNQWTVLSIIPAIAGFLALAVYQDVGIALLMFLLSALLDAVDGGVARVTGAVTNLGAYLDGMVDRLVESLLLIGLMFVPLPPTEAFGYTIPMYLWLVVLLFFGSGMVSYARAYADHRKVVTSEKKLRMMGGVLERAERLILILAGMVLYLAVGPMWLSFVIVAAALLSVLTLFQRVWFVVKNAE